MPMGRTASHRSSSVKPSMRSSRSRITLVGYNSELEPKIDVDVMYGTTNNAKDFSWFDHLLAVFCISRRAKIETGQTNISEREPEPKDPQVREKITGENNVITDRNLRSISILHGCYRSTYFQLKGTNTDILYPRKRNVPLTLVICKVTLYPEPFSSTYSVTQRQTSIS